MLVALDCESEGLLWQHKAFCATTCDNENGSLFWDLTKDREDLVQYLQRATKIICHNLKFDAQKMLLAGVLTEDDLQYPGRYEDTLIMGHLLDEHRSNRLKDLAKTVLEEETDEAKVLAKVRRELGLTKDDGYDKIPLEVLKPYALKDAEFTYRLFKIFDTAVRQPSNKPLYDLYRREIRFVFTLMKVEEKGLLLGCLTAVSKILNSR